MLRPSYSPPHESTRSIEHFIYLLSSSHFTLSPYQPILNPSRRCFDDQFMCANPQDGLEDSIANGRAVLGGLAKILPFAASRLSNVESLRVDCDRNQCYSPDPFATQLATQRRTQDSFFIHLIRHLPAGALKSLEGLLIPLETLSTFPWAAAALQNVQNLHAHGDPDDIARSSLTCQNLVNMMPKLQCVHLETLGESDTFPDHLSNLSEIHLEYCQVSIDGLASLLRRSAQSVRKIILQKSFRTDDGGHIHRAFRGLDFPKLPHIDLQVAVNWASEPWETFLWSECCEQQVLDLWRYSTE